jgi:hypothetical protein
MKNCKDIENRLPLYVEDSLSAEEKRAVEEHLKSCPNCAKALAQLQKTGRLVDGLAEVEPPPWFKQKIMARVREEAEKKSFTQKWFYPLRIKVPVQVFATIFIVVIAVYIYRAGDEQMKEVLPPQAPAPVMEAGKDQLPEQSTKAPESITSTVAKAKVASRKGMRDEKAVMYDASSGAAAPKAEELKKTLPEEKMSAGAADMAKVTKGDAAVDKKEVNFAALSEKQAKPAKSMPPPSVELERKEEGNVLGASVKQSRAPAAQSAISQSSITLRVANINTAVGEVEKLLAKYEAKNIVKQTSAGKVVISAEIKAQKVKDFITQLKIIGRVEEKELPIISNKYDKLLVIEILSD